MTRIRAILTPTDGLPGPDAAALRAEDAELNRRRLVWLLPVMTVVHVAHVFAFRVTPGEVLTAEVADWRTAVAFVHVVSAAVVGLLALATALLPPDRTTRFGAIAALVYLMHGAAIAAADQIHAPMVTPYMAYAIVTAMLLVLQPLEALVVYLPGAVAVTVALFAFQHDPELRRSMLFHGPSVTVAAVGLAGFLYHARVRDFVLRRTVARQQGELEAWNAELEARVDAQVAEIRAHAAEVETLNAQLKAQVRDRSRELTAALQKLQDRAPTTDTLVVAAHDQHGG
ncbi:MAG: hypothetical protein H6736_12940, partial [Alphaproteobacteria bacterium]|nr:hypothetical protein [Alphaproteobacteria bacterium]